MARKKASKTSSATVKKVPIKVKKTDENWSDYTLEDGTVLSVKQIVLEVFKHEGAFNQYGEPIYEIRGTPVMHSKVPAKLTRKEK